MPKNALTMIPSGRDSVVGLDDLRRHDLWPKLSATQQKVLLAYLESPGDKLAAARKVWNSKKDGALRDMMNRALRNPKIRKLLAFYRGATVTDELFPLTRRELGDLIARRLRETRGLSNKDFIHLAELFIHMRGWDPTAQREAPASAVAPGGRGDSVDDLVISMERRTRQALKE